MSKIYLCDEKKWVEYNNYYIRCVSYFDGEYLEYGYCNPNLKHKMIYICDTLYVLINPEFLPENWIYNESVGYYFNGKKSSIHLRVNPRGLFAYGLPMCYNLCKIPEDAYNSKPKFKDNKSFNDLFPFTYGFEFETSSGHISGDDCYKLALIPVFDGSISGYEYVSAVLPSGQVPEAMDKYMKVLDINTEYNQDCAIHVHIGGFPVDIIAVKSLLKYWQQFQFILCPYLPKYVYNTEFWKSSGKSYCLAYNQISFLQFYQKYTGNELDELDGNKSLFLDNKFDACEEHKWSVHGRYFNMNIMHLISGNKQKTIEFRFIHPTHNYAKLELWIVILSSFVKFVMENPIHGMVPKISLKQVLESTLSSDMVNSIMEKLELIKWNKKWQENQKDFAGLNEKYFNNILDSDSKFNKKLFVCAE